MKKTRSESNLENVGEASKIKKRVFTIMVEGLQNITRHQEIEEKIKKMFQQIQDPYEKYKPPSRKNFLSYSYTLCKFFQILNLHEFAKYFPSCPSTTFRIIK